MYYLVLLIFHRRDKDEQPEFISLVEGTVKDRNRREEVSKMGKTAAQALIEEGKELGALQTRQEDLLKFMRGKFQSVPVSVEQKILTIRDANKLSTLIDNVISANTIDDIDIE